MKLKKKRLAHLTGRDRLYFYIVCSLLILFSTGEGINIALDYEWSKLIPSFIYSRKEVKRKVLGEDPYPSWSNESGFDPILPPPWAQNKGNMIWNGRRWVLRKEEIERQGKLGLKRCWEIWEEEGEKMQFSRIRKEKSQQRKDIKKIFSEITN